MAKVSGMKIIFRLLYFCNNIQGKAGRLELFPITNLSKRSIASEAWWYIPITWRQRQEDIVFNSRQDYVTWFCVKKKNKIYTVVLCLFIASWLESQVLSNIIYRTLNRFSVKYILIRLTPYRQEPLQILSLPRHLYKAVNGANFTRDILHGVLFGSQGCIDGLKAEGSSWGLAWKLLSGVWR